MPPPADLPDRCPPALGAPPVAGVIRTRPEDFRVREVLPFEPDGEGGHWLLYVRKTGCNTGWAATQLAGAARVPPRDVGYAGLKDRHAVTEQWFSVPATPGVDRFPDVTAEGLEVLAAARHRRKLRRGALSGNRFEIVVRELRGETGALEERLEALRSGGSPNYFGPQRFGRGGRNLDLARQLFSGRRLKRRDRGFAISAARSAIFNRVLSRRVGDGSWARLRDGDIAMLDGSRSVFDVPQVDEALTGRAASMDVHPTGPLWGEGPPGTSGTVLELEEEVAAEFGELAAGLAGTRLSQERRALRCRIKGFSWALEDDVLRLAFELPAGSFATSLLAELAAVTDVAGAQSESST